MKKRDIVKSNILFNEIINSGKKISNTYYIICGKEKEFIKNNYGIAVSKKIGNAVVRNKLKRQIRNIVTNNFNLFPNYHNYIIIVKKEILSLKYKEMENKFIELLKKKGETYETK